MNRVRAVKTAGRGRSPVDSTSVSLVNGTTCRPDVVADLRLVIGPWTELERAELIVERKQSDVDLARAAESGGRRPEHTSVWVDHRVAGHVPGRVVVSATPQFMHIYTWSHVLLVQSDPRYRQCVCISLLWLEASSLVVKTSSAKTKTNALEIKTGKRNIKQIHTAHNNSYSFTNRSKTSVTWLFTNWHYIQWSLRKLQSLLLTFANKGL